MGTKRSNERRFDNRGFLAMTVVLLLITATSGHAVEIYSTSFESPDITGRVTTWPDGWLGGSYSTRREGMEDEDSGRFSTPYGSQAACIWSNRSQTVMTTSEAAFQDILVAGVTYSITCNVARATDLSGYYNIKLMVFEPDEFRSQYRDPNASQGGVLAQVTGTATTTNMSEVVTLNFTADASNPHLGRMLAIRISNPSICLVDNLSFWDDTDGSDIAPPQLNYRYPRDGSTTMALSYGFELTFNEAVTNDTGNITIYDASDDSEIETIDVTAGQVSISSNIVRVTRNVILENETTYYVLIDNTAFVDLASNAYAGMASTTDWRFTTPVADGTKTIYYTSFESPVVSNRVLTLPDGWVGGNYGRQEQAIENENSGTYATPWGSQAVAAGGNQDPLTTKETTIEDVLQADFPYTITFNVARPTNAVSGTYRIELIAFDPGDARNDIYNRTRGEVLAVMSGNAYLPDMSAQAVGFTYTAETNSVSLGRLLAVEIDQSTRCLVDNLKLTWVPPPPAGTLLFVR